MNNKKEFPVFNMGTSYILTIFIILCLVTLSVLTLLSAKKDAAYTDRIRDQKDCYYEASKKAYENIEKIDGILVSEGKDISISSLQAEMKKQGLDLEKEAADTVSFQLPINEQMDLHVALQITPSKQPGYIIHEFRKIQKNKWQGDESLHLIQMDH